MTNITTVPEIASYIGRGSATLGPLGRLGVLALGIIFAALAVARGTRLGGAFMHGKGPSLPIGSAGRLILGLVALVMFLHALGIVR